MDDLTKRPTRDLLVELIGEHSTSALYTNALRPLFYTQESASKYGKGPLRRAHRKLVIARELVTRCLAEELPTRDIFTEPSIARKYLQILFAPLEREVFACLFLDTRHHCLHFEILFQGTLDSTTVHPREIVKMALRLNAGAVILAHNHPSGVSEPSQADRLLTTRIRDVLALVEIRVLDHFVMGGDSGVSFAERGWL